MSDIPDILRGIPLSPCAWKIFHFQSSSHEFCDHKTFNGGQWIDVVWKHKVLHRPFGTLKIDFTLIDTLCPSGTNCSLAMLLSNLLWKYKIQQIFIVEFPYLWHARWNRLACHFGHPCHKFHTGYIPWIYCWHCLCIEELFHRVISSMPPSGVSVSTCELYSTRSGPATAIFWIRISAFFERFNVVF